MKYKLILTLVFYTLISCNKQKNKISSHVYQNCNKQPLANTALRFYQPDAGGGDLATVKTDAGGGFSFEYEAKNSAAIKVGLANPGSGYSGFANLPIGKDLDNYSIYYSPICDINVRLNVINNGYTNRDTLYISDFNNNTPPFKYFKKAGPFTTGILYTAPNYYLLNFNYPFKTFEWGYKINNAEFTLKTIKLTPCETAEAVADIK